MDPVHDLYIGLQREGAMPSALRGHGHEDVAMAPTTPKPK
jgi:hypothetical protein